MNRGRRTTKSGLSYRRHGTGRPIVFVHGWCLDGAMWLYEEAALRGAYDVVVPDLLGLGHSEGVAGSHSIEAQAAALVDLLLEANLEDAVLIGFALGAAIAATAATLDDSRIGGLVLAAITSGAEFPADRMVRSMLRDWPEFARRSAEVLCPDPERAATRSWLERTYGAADLAVAIDLAHELGKFEPSDVCTRLTVPTVFIHGVADPVSSIQVARDATADTAGAELVEVEGSRHLVVLDQRAAFHDAVAAFLDRLHHGAPLESTP
jgi:pimeloyl-ACP methyl ester carboxylesterase